MEIKLYALFLVIFILWGCGEEHTYECNADFENLNYSILAHSHNDYEQAYPITNALNHGFKSLEVDIAFDGVDLRVSHDDKNLNEKPLFEATYLIPILENDRLKDSSFLLVDIKNYSPKLIEKLNETLGKYESRFKSRDSINENSSRLQIILSGELPRQDLINNTDNTHLFIDGRFNETDINSPSEIVPMISMNISDISDSNVSDKEQIVDVIDQIHQSGKLIRFWNTNDNEDVWLKLIELNVDIIGVDNIEKFCVVMNANGLVN